MAPLIVRGIEEAIGSRLRERATRHGQSMEAEARDILREALLREALANEDDEFIGLGTRITSLFKGIGLKPGEELERPNWGDMKNPFDERSSSIPTSCPP